MNLSKPDKGSENYIENVCEFHYEPSVSEIFTTWYARNRDIYENRMAGLPNETRVNMLLWKFSKSDHDLYLAYLLPLLLKDFTFEETIEKCEKVFGDNTPLFSSAPGDAVQLSVAIKCEATFNGKTAANDRDINFLGLDWIDMFNVLEPKMLIVTRSQAPIKEKYQRTEDFDHADGQSHLNEN
ncbi:unnamed protein product [Hymenolepis diminuta]|uniref:DUF7083 domain-containing protein n=1 Tax=Hymenolepis diminuta TaxID=6216 RepID=A0A564Y7B5_HYMDI|nr:unnamed protein product [Hymenolepis diminuta]